LALSYAANTLTDTKKSILVKEFLPFYDALL
jgi:hypothetical protein